MPDFSGNAIFLRSGWNRSGIGQVGPGPRLAPKPCSFPKKPKTVFKHSQTHLAFFMKTLMPRQVFIFKKSLCFQPQHCLLNKCTASVKSGKSGVCKGFMMGRGSFWFLPHSSETMDFVGWGEMEGTVHTWEEPSPRAPVPSLGRNRRMGLSSALCIPRTLGRPAWGLA